MKRTAIGIMVKNPINGFVKTRLAQSLGEEVALDIYKQLLFRLKSTLEKLKQTHIFYFHTPEIPKKANWTVANAEHVLQEQGDLGHRMQKAITHMLRGHDRVVLVGADCPMITDEIIRLAFHQLTYTDLTMGPTEDGGYYLIGMKKMHTDLFQGIEWSTDQVAEQSLNTAWQDHLSYALLPELFDIDYEKDWHRWQDLSE